MLCTHTLSSEVSLPHPSPREKDRIYCHRHRMTNWPPDTKDGLIPKE